jgi:hypothetical protein
MTSYSPISFFNHVFSVIATQPTEIYLMKTISGTIFIYAYILLTPQGHEDGEKYCDVVVENVTATICGSNFHYSSPANQKFRKMANQVFNITCFYYVYQDSSASLML